MEEAGHIAATLTESMLEKAFEMGERFVTAAAAVDGVGVIGPFALQCVIVSGPPKEFVCYDVSLRIPGSPGTRYTPYSAVPLGTRRLGRRAHRDGAGHGRATTIGSRTC